MRSSANTFRKLLLLAIVLPISALAQQPKQPHEPTFLSYGFVSPNTAENLTLADAIKNLESPEEGKLVYETRRIGCQARFKPTVMRALGSWSDGAEHSVVFKTTTSSSRIRYAVASLGKLARQKAVLYFQRDDSAGSRLYTFYVTNRKDLLRLSKILDTTGIAFRTLVPLKQRILIYVVDLKNELREKIPVAARSLRAQVRTMRGRAEFIGDDTDRDKGQTIFSAEIQSFESQHAVPSHCDRLPALP
jgi:hypothetical protein